MTYNKTSRSRKRTPVKTRRPMTAMILLFGIFLGVFCSAVIFQKISLPWPSQGPKNKLTKTEKSETAVSLKDTPKRPRFDFYSVLPNQNVEIQEDTLSLQQSLTAKTQPVSPQVQPEPTALYTLQAGSFRKASEADELKANLTLIGFQASVKEVSLQNGDVWYRVILGPFDSRQVALNHQKQLEKQNVRGTLVVKQS